MAVLRDLLAWLDRIRHQVAILVTGAVVFAVTFALGQVPEDRYVPGWVWFALGFVTLSIAQFRVWRQARHEADAGQAAIDAGAARRERIATAPLLKGETFWVYELLGHDAEAQVSRQAQTVENRRFEDCVFVGPVIVMFRVHTALTACKWVGRREGMLWPIVGGRFYQGPIAFVNCEFQRCTFVGIGVADNEEGLKQFENMPTV